MGVMTELARTLSLILIFCAGIAIGRFGGAWIDGTYLARTDADLIAQGRADQAAKSAVDIERATVAKNAALRQLGAVRAPVNLECPPGTGPVSDAALERFRATK